VSDSGQCAKEGDPPDWNNRFYRGNYLTLYFPVTGDRPIRQNVLRTGLNLTK